MILMCKEQVVDLSKCEVVRFYKSFNGYVVQAVSQNTSFVFDKTITICELKTRTLAEALVNDIAIKWSEGNVSYDVEGWIKNHRE